MESTLSNELGRHRANGATQQEKPQRNFEQNSAQAQRLRLGDSLRIGPVTTIGARAKLDVLHPAGRIKEMRERGWQILTEWVHEPTDCGKLHRVARYVLIAEGGAL
jgi:hypothetical protein